MGEYLLEVKDLRVEFDMPKGITHILNNLSLNFEKESFLGLVGESGSGKTVFAYSLMGFAKQPGYIAGGEILYNGQNILEMSEPELISKYRSKEVGLIASNARAHLNPLWTVGKQLSTVYSVHTGASKKESNERALEMLELVKINDPKRRFNSYPHELSGGMAQRIMIAMALINNPKIIIADDCTNGLDVTVAAQILDLILDIMEKQKSSCIFITHDLGIVAQCCTHVAIMYSGQIIETAPTREFFKNCKHPYSRLLLDSLPERLNKSGLVKIPAEKLDYFKLPQGCLYYDSCPTRRPECEFNEPSLNMVSEGHYVKCDYPSQDGYTDEGKVKADADEREVTGN